MPNIYYIVINPLKPHKEYYLGHFILHNRKAVALLTIDDKKAATPFHTRKSARKLANYILLGFDEIEFPFDIDFNGIFHNKGKIKLTVKSNKELTLWYKIKQSVLNWFK